MNMTGFRHGCRHRFQQLQRSVSGTLALLVCLPLIAACSSVTERRDNHTTENPAPAPLAEAMIPESAAPDWGGYTDPILHYYAWLNSAADAAVASERSYLEFHYHDSEDPILGVQLALVLSLDENSDPANRERAAQILDSVLNGSGLLHNAEDEQLEYAAFARLWQGVLHKREQLQENTSELERTRARLRADIEHLQSVNEELEQQIEALKAIEQQLNLREQLQVLP